MADEISVVICAYTEKRWNELTAAIASAQSQTFAPEEIIVVIDHNPSLLLRVQEHVARLSGVIAIENHREKGLSGARNSGWLKAQGEIIVFLDDDALAEPDWLEKLVTCYADPKVVGVGGKLVPLWESHKPFWFPDEFNWVVGCTYRGMPATNARIRNPIGANMSMRKSILAATGGFREAFGCDRDTSPSRNKSKWFYHSAGDEETEFCIRVSQQFPGSVWLYAALAVVHHKVSVDRTRLKYFLWRCYDEGLGKASLVKLHSTSTGLSSERTYTFKVLPVGVARGFAETFFRLQPAGVCRAGAIVIGLGMTTIGYLIGSISSRITDRQGTNQVHISYQDAKEAPEPVEVL